MKFRTQYDSHDRVSACAGSPVRTVYGGRYDANGRVVLEKKGEEDFYGYIQSFKDSVDINVILARFTNGDTEALSRAQGFYADVTDFPSNMADALNRINECEEMFKALPLDVRQKFDCSFEQFLSQSGSAEWLEKMGMSGSVDNSPQVEAPVVQEMKQEVNSVES
jgi:hypothetical protein